MSNKGRKIDVSMRGHQAALRRLGFRRDYYGAKTRGSPWVASYLCEFLADEVQLEVQLWGDGQHRVTYAHANLFVHETERSPYGCQSTQPESFSTVDEMLAAIERQRKHWLGGEKAVEEEYVQACRDPECSEPPTRDRIREELAARKRRAELVVVQRRPHCKAVQRSES